MLKKDKKGSSPRMRGARSDNAMGWLTGRIIPADAGSTAKFTGCTGIPRDHPRGCGEHQRKPDTDGAVSGSSPRMRGARYLMGACPDVLRIIPADAGSTPGCAGHTRPGQDHPRGCGEHTQSHDAHLRLKGSSPRMRGAPTMGFGWRADGRIIPADAGSTCHRG